ncbi:hypothetical protein BDR26DRAFT_914594 [Obelidium mucronatum]|nr:hypothetical protein BDR26DRAFT_914594 [Obelidium mucronatum]
MAPFQFPPQEPTPASSNEGNCSHHRLLDRRFSMPIAFDSSIFSHQLQSLVPDSDPLTVSELSRRMSLQYPLPDLTNIQFASNFEFPTVTQDEVSMMELMSSPIPPSFGLSNTNNPESNDSFIRRMSLPFAFPSDSSDAGFMDYSGYFTQELDSTPEYYNTNEPEQGSIDPAETFCTESLNRVASPLVLPITPPQSHLSSTQTRKSSISTTPAMALSYSIKRKDSYTPTTPEPGMDMVLATPPSSPRPSRRASIDSGKHQRFKPTESELVMLTAIFQKNPFPSTPLRKKLAERMGLDVKQVQFWFQNRRASMKQNGIHVVKPTKSSGSYCSKKTKRASLSPLSADSLYFFVDSGLYSDVSQNQSDAHDV